MRFPSPWPRFLLSSESGNQSSIKFMLTANYITLVHTFVQSVLWYVPVFIKRYRATNITFKTIE